MTFFHVTDSEEDTAAAQSMVNDAAEHLRYHAIPADAIATEVRVSGTPVQAIATAAADHDAVVMGENERTGSGRDEPR